MCDTPYLLRDKSQFVPCGKCPKCKQRDISQWCFRLMNQQKVCESAYFITLTYDNYSVPVTSKKWCTLKKDDVQKFIKRLRSDHVQYNRKMSRMRKYDGRFPADGIKYFAVGEYGTQSYRPHYHIILFNVRIELVYYAWGLTDKKTGEFVSFGDIHYGDSRGVTEASVCYCMKYIDKPRKIPLHKNDDRLPEFRVMSKKLGMSYLQKEVGHLLVQRVVCQYNGKRKFGIGRYVKWSVIWQREPVYDDSRFVKWHRDDLDNRMYVNLGEGKKCAMPRYYKLKLYSDVERHQVGLATIERMYQKEIDEFAFCDDPHLEWRNKRERIMAQARIAALSKKLVRNKV